MLDCRMIPQTPDFTFSFACSGKFPICYALRETSFILYCQARHAMLRRYYSLSPQSRLHKMLNSGSVEMSYKIHYVNFPLSKSHTKTKAAPNTTRCGFSNTTPLSLPLPHLTTTFINLSGMKIVFTILLSFVNFFTLSSANAAFFTSSSAVFIGNSIVLLNLPLTCTAIVTCSS